MAVEVKWLSYNGGRSPNGEFQRFVGQCTLAAARHKAVLGICCISGHRAKPLTTDQEALEQRIEKVLNGKLDQIGVRLVVLGTVANRRAG